MKRLSESQLSQIRTFLQQRGICYQELEDELLDYIAEEVESRMGQGESFYDATKAVFSEFGPFSFRKIQASYEQSLEKNAFHLAWDQFKSYWTSRKLAISVLLITVFWFLTNLPVDSVNTYFPAYCLTLIVLVGGSYWWFLRQTRLKSYRKKGHALLMGAYNLDLLFLVFGSGIMEVVITKPALFVFSNYLLLMSNVLVIKSLCILKNKQGWARGKIAQQ